MKKNFIMWILTFIVAFLGVVFAVVSFFKNKNFFRCFKNSEDDFESNDENEELDEDLNDEVENVDDKICDIKNYDVDRKASEEVDSLNYVDLDDDGEGRVDHNFD